MMLETKKQFFVVAEDFVNLSGKLCTIYDDATGEILLLPCFEAFITLDAALEIYESRSPERAKFYIFCEEKLGDFEVTGIDLRQIALMRQASPGRMGKPINRLYWASDPTKSVIVRGYAGDNGIVAQE